MNLCPSCGHDVGYGPEVEHCNQCPPWVCDGCGEMDSMADPCQCWTSFEGTPLPDLKAMFARIDLSITTDGGAA